MTYPRVPDHAGLRLHFNENTAGCSPAVLAAIRSIGREDTGFYPDYREITTRCERSLGVAPGWVQLTNGLDEGLHVAAQAASLQRPADPGPAVIIVEPAFEMYAACAEGAGLAATHVQPGPDFAFPIDAVLGAITTATRLIYLTDPNNPTGLAIPRGDVESIADAAPGALVFVDEAYAEFSGRTFVGAATDRRRNLVVGRTFAKAHGLAALRVGLLVGHPDTLAPLRRLLPPYSVNVCAVRALDAALDDRAYLEWYVAQSEESRRLIYASCARLGLEYWKSQGNFVLIRIGDGATDVVQALADRAIHVRDRSKAPGCAGCVRITAGTVEATERCLAALEGILAPRPR